MSGIKSAPVSPVDGEANAQVDVLQRLKRLELLAHRHRAGYRERRNIFDNGAMLQCIRGSSFSGVTATKIVADRFNCGIETQGTWTCSIENDGPAGTGLTKSLKMLCTTADAAPAAADRIYLSQVVEGANVQRMLKGTANALPTPITFWYKTNKAGVFPVELRDGASRQVSTATLVSTGSGTWVPFTFLFPADTAGTPPVNDFSDQFAMLIWLGAGTNYTSGTLQTSWATAVQANRAVGVTNLAAATNNYFQITGVQGEIDVAPSEFEHLPIAQVVSDCQRYAFCPTWAASINAAYIGAGYAGNTVGCNVNVPFPTTMRAVPGLDLNGSAATDYILNDGATSIQATAIANDTNTSSFSSGGITVSVGSGLTAGKAYRLLRFNNAVRPVFSADL